MHVAVRYPHRPLWICPAQALLSHDYALSELSGHLPWVILFKTQQKISKKFVSMIVNGNGRIGG